MENISLEMMFVEAITNAHFSKMCWLMGLTFVSLLLPLCFLRKKLPKTIKLGLLLVAFAVPIAEGILLERHLELRIASVRSYANLLPNLTGQVDFMRDETGRPYVRLIASQIIREEGGIRLTPFSLILAPEEYEQLQQNPQWQEFWERLTNPTPAGKNPPKPSKNFTKSV